MMRFDHKGTVQGISGDEKTILYPDFRGGH